jgi:hypothetical protein
LFNEKPEYQNRTLDSYESLADEGLKKYNIRTPDYLMPSMPSNKIILGNKVPPDVEMASLGDGAGVNQGDVSPT